MKPYIIRTTVISPGAVATEPPNSVTEPDVAEGVQKFYKRWRFRPNRSRRRLPAMGQPQQVDINEILFRSTRQEL